MIARSVKSRLILWICAFTSICMLIALALLLTQAYKLEISRAHSRMEDAARDAADEVEYDRHGRLSIDDDIVYYRDEVTIIIIDRNLSVVTGRFPAAFDASTPIALGQTRYIDGWIVLDIISDEPSLVVRAVYSMGSINENMSRLIMTALAVFVGFICVLAWVSFVIAKYSFMPLYIINNTLNAVEPGREGERVVLKNAADEFNELARNVNDMLNRLETSLAMEKRFTSDVSHELRTPLGIMLSNLEYAQSRPDDIEAATAAVEACREQTEKMIELVTKLLLIARADSGRMRLERENVDLSELCLAACEQQREIAASRGVELVSDIQPEIFVYGDETMLLVVLTNLLENAVKYHRDKGFDRFVRLELKDDSGYALISVIDNGRGIPKEHIDAIWDRFRRVDAAVDAKEGSGLGLSIVRHLVLAHGGEYGAESEPGKLTRVWVRVPMAETGR